MKVKFGSQTGIYKSQLDWESIRSSPRDGFRDGWGGWHFDNGALSKIDDVLIEDGGLLHVLPLTVHLNFFLTDKLG